MAVCRIQTAFYDLIVRQISGPLSASQLSRSDSDFAPEDIARFFSSRYSARPAVDSFKPRGLNVFICTRIGSALLC